MSSYKMPSLADVADFWSAQWGAPCPTDRCWGCLQDLPLSRAHIVARRKGGSKGVENLMIACVLCNSAIDETEQLHGAERAIQWIRTTIRSGRVQVPPNLVERFSAAGSAEAMPPLDAAMAMVDGWKLACRFRGENMVQWHIKQRLAHG